MKKTKTFKSGNSIAVRLPKALGIEPGIEMTVREERGRYIIEPVDDPTAGKRVDLTGIYGCIEAGAVFREPDEYEDIPREWHLLGLGP